MRLLVLFSIPISFLSFTNAAVESAKLAEISDDTDIPANFDWRNKGAVTKIKDQGICSNSDWAFAATGALEAQLFQVNHGLNELSEQELIDCTQKYGNYGCDGGNPEAAFRYIEDNGISSAQSYPYTGEESKCRTNQTQTRIVKRYAIKYKKIPREMSETIMKREIYEKGPILAMVNVPESFVIYNGGIYDNEQCVDNGIHNVLIVGYGVTEKSEEYWIIKNSWGENWGEEGYIRIARNKNMCGIATNAAYIITDFEILQERSKRESMEECLLTWESGPSNRQKYRNHSETISYRRITLPRKRQSYDEASCQQYETTITCMFEFFLEGWLTIASFIITSILYILSLSPCTRILFLKNDVPVIETKFTIPI